MEGKGETGRSRVVAVPRGRGIAERLLMLDRARRLLGCSDRGSGNYLQGMTMPPTSAALAHSLGILSPARTELLYGVRDMKTRPAGYTTGPVACVIMRYDLLDLELGLRCCRCLPPLIRTPSSTISSYMPACSAPSCCLSTSQDS